MIIRHYIDKTGKPRRLKYLHGGNFIHWHRQFSASWSEVWEDLDEGGTLQIPLNAWKCLKIDFQDEEIHET
jgi:hypothetical protein